MAAIRLIDRIQDLSDFDASSLLDGKAIVWEDASSSFISSNVVLSLNGRAGAVSLTSGDVTTALGFTPRDAAAVTVSTFNTRSGSVSLTSSDVTTALTYTPANPGAQQTWSQLQTFDTILLQPTFSGSSGVSVDSRINASGSNSTFISGRFYGQVATGHSNISVMGLRGKGVLPAGVSGTVTSMVGVEGESLQQSVNGVVTLGVGVDASIYGGGGATTTAYAVRSQISGSTGGMTTAAIFRGSLNANSGTISSLAGLKLDSWSNSGTVTTSYGIYADNSIDVGTTKYFIYSTSASPSLLSGDLTTTGLLKTGSTPVTLTNAAGKILGAALVGTDIATVGTITAGTWNGAVIGSAYGGAGGVSGILKADGNGTVSAVTVGEGLSFNGTTLYNTISLNQTDGVIPYRLNSGAFTDSPIARLGANSISIGNVGSFGGLQITGNVAGNGVDIQAISSGVNEALNFISKGSGNVTFLNGAQTAGLQLSFSTSTLNVVGLDTALGTITAGTWNGSVIGATYGGAGTVTGILKANGSGTVSAVTIGSGLSFDGTTLSSTGAGTTINATDGVIPYRLNSGAFADSPLAVGGIGATGLTVTGATAGSGLTLAVTSSGASERLILMPKGASGKVLVKSPSTGDVSLGYMSDFTNYGAIAIGNVATLSSSNYHLAATGLNDLIINSGSTIDFRIGNSAKWQLSSGGHFLAGADNSYDIGDATHRLRTLYAGTSVYAGSVQIGGWPADATYAMFRNSALGGNEYAFIQSSTGDTYFNAASAKTLNFNIGASNLWQLGAAPAAGTWLPNNNNAYDIGDATHQVRTIYAGTSVRTPVVADANGNTALALTATASAVNYLTVVNGAAGSPATVELDATGASANINLQLKAKGTGLIVLGGNFAGGYVGSLRLSDPNAASDYIYLLASAVQSVIGIYGSGGHPKIAFTATANAENGWDAVIERTAAGLLEINNNSSGTYRDLLLRNLILGGTANSNTLLKDIGGSGGLHVRTGDDLYYQNVSGQVISSWRYDGAAGLYVRLDGENRRVLLGSTISLAYSSSSVVEVNDGTGGQWGGLKAGFYGAATNAVANGITIGTRSSSTPAAGLGAGILFNIDSSTTADQNAAQIAALWTTATHASRSADLAFSVVNNAATLAEAMRLTSVGNLKIGGTASRGTTEATKAISLFAGTAPAGTLASGVTLYSKDSGAGLYKLYYMDSAGTEVAVGAGGGAGTVTNTGTLTSGQLIKGNGSADITVGDLTGDVSTSGSMTTTIGASKVTNAMLAGSIAISKLSITGTPDGTKFLRDDGAWAAAGSGTVSSGTATRLAWYSSTGTTVSDQSALTYDSTNTVFNVQAGWKIKRTATATNYTVLLSDYLIGVTSTAAARTITLPSVASASGQIFHVVDESNGAGTNNITVQRAGTDTFNDSTTSKAITTNSGVLTVYSNGSNWIVF